QVAAVLGDNRIARFDGSTIEVLSTRIDPLLARGVSAMQALEDGLLAVAISGQGLYFLERDGGIARALEDSAFASVSDLSAGPDGVLWLSTAEGVTKLLYDTPVSRFDHRLGLDLNWPDVARQGDTIFVFSGGRVFRSVPGRQGEPT